MKIPTKPTYSSRTMRHLHWSCCFVEMCVWLLMFIIWVKWHSMSALSVSYVYSGSGNPKKNTTHQFRLLKQKLLGTTIVMQPCRFVPKKTCSETSSATDGTKLDQNIGFQGLALLDSGPNLQPCGFSHISFMTTLGRATLAIQKIGNKMYSTCGNQCLWKPPTTPTVEPNIRVSNPSNLRDAQHLFHFDNLALKLKDSRLTPRGWFGL